MAAMSGAAMTSCLDQLSVSSNANKKHLLLRRSPSAGVLSSCSPRCASITGHDINAQVLGRRLSSAGGLRSDRQGFSGLASSSAVVGSHFLPRLYSREGGFSNNKTKRNFRIVAQARKNSVNAPERILAALGYVLPFFDGIHYGRYFFLQYPVAEALLRPLYPILAVYKGFPYSNFIAFFSLYLLVVRNQNFSRYVRFNTMQAVVLDVLLIIPSLVDRTFAPRGGLGFELLIIFYNTVFLFLVACFLFGVFSCLLGKTPRLPIVADAADNQV